MDSVLAEIAGDYVYILYKGITLQLIAWSSYCTRQKIAMVPEVIEIYHQTGTCQIDWTCVACLLALRKRSNSVVHA